MRNAVVRFDTVAPEEWIRRLRDFDVDDDDDDDNGDDDTQEVGIKNPWITLLGFWEGKIETAVTTTMRMREERRGNGNGEGKLGGERKGSEQR